MNIYQIFTRLYGNPVANNVPSGTIEQNGSAKLNGYTIEALKRIYDYGFSHLWLTGVIEHATQTDYSAYGIHKDHPLVVKGKAGSPYAIKDYYDIDPDLAEDVNKRMQEFEALVERCHRVGLKLIIDFVPNHVARQYASDAAPEGVEDLGASDDVGKHFSKHNNFYYCWGQSLQTEHLSLTEANLPPYKESPAKATGNDQFSAWPGINDWYETIKLNYGIDYTNGSTHFNPIPDTWQKMLNILLFWASKGVDAFRCDMAEMVPVEFWHYAIARVKARYPQIIFIAEVYNPALYRSYVHHGGFDFLYDKVGLYDTLRNIVARRESAAAITGCWQSTDDIREHLLYFLENHDEQRIASDFFCGDAFKAFPAMVVAALMGKNPLMIYAGQELGERGMEKEGFSGCDGRTTIFDYWSPSTLRKLATLPSPLQDIQQGNKSTLLTKDETTIYQFYHRLLTLRQQHEAFCDGLFYDLMYVNYESKQGFLPEKHFAFLRRSSNEVVLCVVNFSDDEHHVQVFIPKHAFHFLSLPQGEFSVVELISGQTSTLTLFENDYTSLLTLQPNQAIALAFST